MKLSILFFSLVIAGACKKEALSAYDEIAGDWDWKSSQRLIDGNLYTYLPADSTPTLITFHNYKTFENSSPWTWLSPIQGTYELTNILHNGTDAKVFILRYQQVGQDTLLLKIDGKQMELETMSRINYHSIHKFTKR